MPPRGAVVFEKHYQAIFGDRWAKLRECLKAPVQHVARLNGFARDEALTYLPDDAKPVQGLPDCFVAPHFEPPQPMAESGLMPYYLMDGASIFPALALDVEEGDCVLDMCAAPGGKSLILAEHLGDRGLLTSNDPSAARRARLGRVLREYIPAHIHAACVQVTGHDGAKWNRFEQNAFDKILLDAPCSSDRQHVQHVLEESKQLKEWSGSRIKQNAKRQEDMLVAAIDIVRVGGRIVYSTCALSGYENDRVIHRVLKRRKDQIKVVQPQEPVVGDKTKYGVHILPDSTQWGPIFYAVLERVA
ncbi:hypothetical protein PTSG_04026 [Salpingoeca rosetta]|uniref:NOL1/NOP2/Sun domain family member 4 n=1 Tax=Salpingoeca rosetta (strain ATCC 50818 / BSB-021) TaxID=946362 RepID=F2U7K1_SALR5|nr:uncharacterized protein PTSG_04026 [Salpingoeca rosetta]EGD83418.1 hypothetical protein PTSG_04026 [Salpingoeca rosetta]|eukprot:XP_004994922.1 hypothetical protein PTSG_04026 [Salpingoeca rosetta]